MDGFCLEILGSVLAAHADEQTRGTFAPFRSSSEAPQTVAKKNKKNKLDGLDQFGDVPNLRNPEKMIQK